MSAKTISEKLKELRGEKQQQQIAEEVGVHPATWSRAEKYGAVTAGFKLAILRTFGVDLDQPS